MPRKKRNQNDEQVDNLDIFEMRNQAINKTVQANLHPKSEKRYSAILEKLEKVSL